MAVRAVVLMAACLHFCMGMPAVSLVDDSLIQLESQPVSPQLEAKQIVSAAKEKAKGIEEKALSVKHAAEAAKAQIQAAKTKVAEAQAEVKQAAATKEALKGEKAKAKELQSSLTDEQKKVEAEKERAETAMKEVKQAKTKLKAAAKTAIKGAIKNAAAVANAEQKRLVEQEANERGQKGATSARALAAEAKAAAKQKMAEDMMKKAQKMMEEAKQAKAEAEKTKQDAQKASDDEAQTPKLKEAMDEQLQNEKSAEEKSEQKVQEEEEEVKQVKAEKEKFQQEVAAATAAQRKESKRYAALHQRATKISQGALTCDEVVEKLHAEVKSLREKVKQSYGPKSQMVQSMIAKVNNEKERVAAAKTEISELRNTVATDANKIQGMTVNADGLQQDATSMAKGLRMSEHSISQLEEKLEVMKEQHAKTLSELGEARKQADMLKECQDSKAQALQEVKSSFATTETELKQRVAKAETRATISKRGYELCKGELQAANAAGASMKATAMKNEAELAQQTANQKEQVKAMAAKIKADVTHKVKQQERERYDARLEQAVSKLQETKPMTPKCQACAKLSSEERLNIGAQCGDC